MLSRPTLSLGPRTAVDVRNAHIDQKDDLLELQYWKKKFEDVRMEAQKWKGEVGVCVFGDSVAWLEQEIMSLV